MRRLPASSVFRGPKLGKQGLPTEFRYQGIISYRVVEAFEPLDHWIVPTPLRPPRRGFPPNVEWQPIGGLRVALKLDEAPRVASGTGAE